MISSFLVVEFGSSGIGETPWSKEFDIIVAMLSALLSIEY